MKKDLVIACEETEWLYVPDVLYTEYKDCKRHLQLFIPYMHEWKEDKRYPLVVFIPGSAWYRQEMYNSLPSYAKLAERGFVTAVVQYRESTIARFPAQVEDVERAVLFLLSKAAEFHIDGSRIYLAGNSSGGHIALMTAFRKANGIDDADGADLFTVQGVIAESAPSDMFMCAATPLPDFLPPDFAPTKDLLGVKALEDNFALAKEAGCEMYIRKEVSLPPVLLLHGTDDCQVDVKQSRRLYRQLTEAQKEVSYYELTGCDHGGPAFWSDAVLDIIDRFIHEG